MLNRYFRFAKEKICGIHGVAPIYMKPQQRALWNLQTEVNLLPFQTLISDILLREFLEQDFNSKQSKDSDD